MSKVMEEEFKRWTAKRKAALVMEIILGKQTVADWIGFYNHRRPHQALGMKTPAEWFALAA